MTVTKEIKKPGDGAHFPKRVNINFIIHIEISILLYFFLKKKK